MSLNNIFDIAGSAMSAQSIRLSTTASNLANANTANSGTGSVYRARHPLFAAIQNQVSSSTGSIFPSMDDQATAGVQVLEIVESKADSIPRYEPNHPLADSDGFVYYPSVNVVEEMTDMISASRSFQMNVEVMNSAKSMMQRVLSIGQ